MFKNLMHQKMVQFELSLNILTFSYFNNHSLFLKNYDIQFVSCPRWSIHQCQFLANW